MTDAGRDYLLRVTRLVASLADDRKRLADKTAAATQALTALSRRYEEANTELQVAETAQKRAEADLLLLASETHQSRLEQAQHDLNGLSLR